MTIILASETSPGFQSSPFGDSGDWRPSSKRTHPWAALKRTFESSQNRTFELGSYTILRIMYIMLNYGLPGLFLLLLSYLANQ